MPIALERLGGSPICTNGYCKLKRLASVGYEGGARVLPVSSSTPRTHQVLEDGTGRLTVVDFVFTVSIVAVTDQYLE